MTAPGPTLEGRCGHLGALGVDFADLSPDDDGNLTSWCAVCARRQLVRFVSSGVEHVHIRGRADRAFRHDTRGGVGDSAAGAMLVLFILFLVGLGIAAWLHAASGGWLP